MMWSFFVCALGISLTACHHAEAPLPDIFPENAGLWHRTSLREMKASDTPDAVPQATIEKLRAATYEGPGKLEARAYQMSTSAVALDVVQRWRATPDTIFFYAGRFFVVVKWEAADRKALQEFVGLLEKRLNATP